MANDGDRWRFGFGVLMSGWVQCVLVRGTSTRVSWIPAELAWKGVGVRAEGENEVWLVATAYRSKIKAERPDVHSAGKRHKRRTGDLPD